MMVTPVMCIKGGDGVPPSLLPNEFAWVLGGWGNNLSLLLSSQNINIWVGIGINLKI